MDLVTYAVTLLDVAMEDKLVALLSQRVDYSAKDLLPSAEDKGNKFFLILWT